MDDDFSFPPVAPPQAPALSRPARLLTVGEISTAMDLPINPGLLAELGFRPTNTAARLYLASDFGAICRALIARIEAAAAAFEGQ